jgi:hypothetical protein
VVAINAAGFGSLVAPPARRPVPAGTTDGFTHGVSEPAASPDGADDCGEACDGSDGGRSD